MNNRNHIATLNELSTTEGIFTTAQAARLGLPRNALSQAVRSGRAERVIHGAYRLAGAPSSFHDELTAIWKLTAPATFTYERMQPNNWDGIVVGGETAASMQDIGDFYLSPYRIYSPKRINSRIKDASFGVRVIDPKDVMWVEGLPVTRPERTILDLCLDDEDWSLVEDTFVDIKDLDSVRLRELVSQQRKSKRVQESISVIEELLTRYLHEDK